MKQKKNNRERKEEKGKERRSRISDALVEKAIKGSFGNVSFIARRLGVARMTVYRRIYASPKLLELFEEETQTLVDNAENELMALMNPATNEDPRTRLEAVKFFLDRRGKSRGWGAQQEVAISHASSVRPVIRFDTLPKDGYGEGDGGNGEGK